MLRLREGHTLSAGDQRGGLIARLGAGVLGFAALLAVFSAPAPALDSGEPRAKASAAIESARAQRDQRIAMQVAMQEGLESYRAGDAKASIEALRSAADGGEPLAAWRLARIYADGDGVARDDRKAFDYFSKIVERFANDDPSPGERFMVSNAFVAFATYLRDGAPSAGIAADPERAFDLLRYAATFFRSADAQFSLARMYIDGVGVKKDTRQGMNWLSLAARKGHNGAQALLGEIMFEGSAERPRGLMYLTLARAAAGDRPADKWIVEMHQKALASASEADRKAADGMVESYLKRRD